MKILRAFSIGLVFTVAMGPGHFYGGEIHQAARAGNLARIKELLKAKPDLVNEQEAGGSTALHEAVEHPEMVDYLLAQGAAVNAVSVGNFTPLHAAAFQGFAVSVDTLLAHGADASAAATNGTTALQVAAMRDHKEVVAVLLKHRVNLEGKDKLGHTALHLAAKAGNLEVVRMLVEAGADVTSKNLVGFKPLDLVSGRENDAMATFLEEQMARVARSDGALPARVGELGGLEQLQFRGAKTFSATAIRNGLLMNPEFLLASHFAAPFRDYITTLERLIRTGFQEAGFAEPKVAVQFDSTNRVFVITVDEGQRFKRGEVQLVGAKTIPVDQFIRRLTLPYPPPDQTSVRMAFESKTDAADPPDGKFRLKTAARISTDGSDDKFVLDKFGKKVKRQEPIWPVGKPAPLAPATLAGLQAAVTNLLPEFGLFFATVEVKLVPDKATGTALLKINITDEGPRGIVDEIRIRGNERDSREEILRYLKLKSGVAMNHELISRLEQALWNSARFRQHSVEVERIDPKDNRVRLVLDLQEYTHAPPLRESFSANELTLLQAREWLAGFPARREDLVIAMTNEYLRGEAILSPQGILFSVADAKKKPGQVQQACLLAPGMEVFFSPERQRKLVLPDLGYQLLAYLSILPEPETNKAPFSISMGGGFRHVPEEAGDQAPFQLDLTLAPAAFIDLVHRDGFTNKLEQGVLSLIGSNSVMRFDAATGQLIEMIEGAPMGASVRVTSNAFARASQELIRGGAGLTNLFRPERPLSSPLAYICRELAESPLVEMWQTNLPGPDPKNWQALAGVAGRLLSQDVLAPLDQLVVQHSLDWKQQFFIPLEQKQGQSGMQMMLTFGAAVVHRVSNELFPAHSWPWTVPREAVFVLTGNDKFTGFELERLYESDQTGPLGFFAIAKLLSYTSSPHSRSFAARGLDRLKLADFHKDCRLILEGQPVMVATVDKIVTACAALTEEDLNVIAGVTDPKAAQAIRIGVAALRGRKDKPLKDVLQPMLDLYWEASLKQQLEQALKNLANPTVDKKA